MAYHHQQNKSDVHVGDLNLPPGFRFRPSDDEIVSHYLMNKVHNTEFDGIAIREVDLNKTEPWDLPDEARWGENEWYFFYQKDRKYPRGLRANRATEAGYWKATGKDKEVNNTREGVVLLVGMKKTLVFYKGRAPGGEKTNWVMHEYRLEGSGKLPCLASASSSTTNSNTAMKASAAGSKDEWVLCRVFDKTNRIKKMTAPGYHESIVGIEIDQNQNNIPTIPIPIPMPLPLPLQVPMPMQFPILPNYAIDPVVPYYLNIEPMMPPMMLPMAGIISIGELQIHDAMFGNQMVAPQPMNFYHQMGMGIVAGQINMEAAVGQMGMGAVASQMGLGPAAGQVDVGAAGAGVFNFAASESRPSSVVQQDNHTNAAENSSMMSVTSPGSATTTIEMDGIWKYKY